MKKSTICLDGFAMRVAVFFVGMKTSIFGTGNLVRSRLLVCVMALAVVMAAGWAQAAGPYYWDNNGATAGFGTAAGTWAVPTTGTVSQGWSTDGTGGTLPVDQTTTYSDVLHFGNGTAGLALGTITVGGTVRAGNMNFATNSGAITLSGGTIDFGTATPTITVSNNTKNVINCNLIGSAGFIFKPAGAGVWNVSGNHTFSLSLGGDNTGLTGSITLEPTAVLYVGANALKNAGLILNGNASLQTATATSSAGVALNNYVLSIGNNTATMSFNGAVTGVGGGITLIQSGMGSTTVNLNSLNNTFTGPISFNLSQPATLSVNSLADSASIGAGRIVFISSPTASLVYNTGASAPLVLNNRQIEFAGSISGTIKNNASAANATITINTDLLVSAAGNKTLTLGGSNMGNNLFAGSITNGTSSTISLTKSEVGTWILSGTNTYSGVTTLTPASPAGTLVFSGSQSLSPNTTIAGSQSSSSTHNIRLLDDGIGTISFNRPITFGGANTSQNFGIFVGNNNTLNGGNSAGTTTGSTIQAGTITFTSVATDTASTTINVTGANNYRLATGTITLNNLVTRTAGQTTVTILNPTTANMTVTAITMATGNTGTVNDGIPVLRFDGISSANYVTGAISDASDYLTGQALSLQKQNISTWTLSGVNTYHGTTTVTGGRLLINGDSSAATGTATVSSGSLGGTGTVGGAVTVSSTGGIDLRDGAVGTLTLGSTLGITGAAGANILYFDLASAGSTVDKIVATGAFSTTTPGAGVITLNQLGGSGNRLTAGTYDLITAASGMTAGGGDFQLATTQAFGQTFSLASSTTTALKLTTTQVVGATPTAYWKGGDINWSTAANWNTDATSNIGAGAAPDYQSNVRFYTTTPAATTLTTGVLDADFNINSLTFDTGTTGVTIGGTKTLTIEAAAVNGNTAGNGITLNNASGTHTISAKVGLAANQTWTVATGGALAVSGAISDFGAGYGLTKAGGGNLTLTGATTYTGGTTITGGILTVSTPSVGAINNGPLTLSGGGRLTVSGANIASASQITVGAGGGLLFVNKNNSFTTSGILTGSGTLTLLDGGGSGTPSTYNFNSTANDFTGGIVLNNAILGVARLDDSANNIVFNSTLATAVVNNNVGLKYGSTALPALTLNNRALEFNSAVTANVLIQNNNTTCAITIGKDLVATGAGAKTLMLDAVAGPANVFAGNITDGSDGGTVALTKTGAGTWALGATNTYSGKTFNNSSGGTLIFQNVQSSLPSTSVLTTAINNNQTQVTKLLSDTSGTINLGNTLKSDGGGSSGTGTMTIFVGNNGTANGGNGAGGITNSTIVLGSLDLRSSLEGGLVDNRMAIEVGVTGANGYKLQIGGVTLAARGTGSNKGAFLKPTSADLTITGTVQQNNGRTAGDLVGIQNLTLDGTTANNLISGSIKDAEDYTAGTNANAMAVNLVKSNTSTWTLSGVNTHSGSNTISGGTLVLAAGTCLSDTNVLTITGTGKLQLETGVQEEVGSLVLGTTTQTDGIWGSSTSGAAYTDNTYFAGTGLLYVGVPIPPSGTVIMFR